MKRMSWVVALGLACGGGSVDATEVAAKMLPERAEQVVPARRVTEWPNAILSALKQNDFAALLEATERNKDIAALAKDWDEQAARQREQMAKRATEVVDPDIAELTERVEEQTQQVWTKLQSADGVDALVSEWQPQIAESVSKHLLEFNLGFGAALTAIASDQDFNVQQVQQMTQLMYAVQNWTGRVDFADPERLRQALTAASRLVVQTKLKRFEDTQSLAFEDAIAHGDAMIVAVKRVFAAYDVDADQILNSVRFAEIDARGDTATLHAEARVFGVDLSHDFKMQWFEGEWIDADQVEVRKRWRDEGAGEATDAAAASID